MRHRLHLACVSACLGAVATSARADDVAAPMTALTAEFRLLPGDAHIEAIAWRAGDEIYVLPDTLAELGVAVVPAGNGVVALSEITGLSYTFDSAQQAVIIACASTCFARQEVRAHSNSELPV